MYTAVSMIPIPVHGKSAGDDRYQPVPTAASIWRY